MRMNYVHTYLQIVVESRMLQSVCIGATLQQQQQLQFKDFGLSYLCA